MNGELIVAVEYFHREKGIDKEVLFQAVESALLQASKRSVGPSNDLRIEIDRKTGNIRALAKQLVVENVVNKQDEISLTDARGQAPNVQLGESIEVEVTPQNFGRIAAQTAKQAMLQRIRQVEKNMVFEEFKGRGGDILSGTVRRFERSDVIVDLGKIEGVMPSRERVPTEEYQPGDRIRAFTLSVDNAIHGPEIILSRSHPDFVRKLFELEVSEIADKTVEIKAIAREAGFRTKIAVLSHDDKVDPVGACVGMRGMRVKNIVRELSGEKIDIIRWDPNVRQFVTNALAPAKLKNLVIDEARHSVKIIVDPDQLSLAIGKKGQNARLTAKLTGWNIEIEKEESAELGFEEKVKRAVEEMAAIPGIPREVAESLVKGGFHSLEGLLSADLNDLTDILGGAEKAAAVQQAANAEQERREAAQPLEGDKTGIMSIRVHDLAKRCGLSNKEMIDKLHLMNYPVKSHSSTVDKITAESIEKEYGYVPPPPPAPEPIAAPTSPAPAPEIAEKAETETMVATLPPPSAVIEPPKAVVERSKPPVVKVVVTAVVSPPPPVIPPKSLPAAVPSKPTPPPRPTSAPVPQPTVKITTAPRATPAPAPAPKPPTVPAGPAQPAFIVDDKGNKVIQMKPPVVVRDLAQRIGVRSHVLLAEMMAMNVFANLSESVGEDIARKICERHGFLFELEKRERGAGMVHAPPRKVEPLEVGEQATDLMPRPPVVTVMGHVDHGKTSLLDAIRKTDVAAHESGGITQHIGASVVSLPGGKTITFLDTPGHEAFTKMRARGANVTDIAILVVAADDGIMPQTLEAISHAKAAQVPVIVAINKCDLPTANPDRVKKQLQEHGLSAESWGGDTITVEVSATTKKGIDTLLEMILLQTEIMELKASPKVPAKGNVIEAQIEPGMGPSATVLVRKGTLHVGDGIVCGPFWAKIRALVNDKGQRIKEAPPSTPVKIVGLSGLPEAGLEFNVMKTDKEARALSEQRQQDARGSTSAEPRGSRLEDILSQLKDGEMKKLHIILKADVQGSLEAIADSLRKLKSEKIELDIIHAAVGSITENDVLLASASEAVIIGFRVKTESGVTDTAKHANVQIRLYTIIYELIEQVEESMEGLLEPESKEAVIGHADVRKVFELSKGPPVAGCVVTDGRIARSARVRLLRRKAVQYEGRISSLKHFQDDVREVKAGAECGLRLENFPGIQEGDVLECYTVEKVAASL